MKGIIFRFFWSLLAPGILKATQEAVAEALREHELSQWTVELPSGKQPLVYREPTAVIAERLGKAQAQRLNGGKFFRNYSVDAGSRVVKLWD